MTETTLILGAGGYLGSRLVDRFVGAGNEVLGLVRNEAAAAGLRSRGAAPVLGDLSRIAETLALLDRADIVIYAAQLMLEAERDTVRALLDRLKGSGKTFIFTSGTGVLSQRTDGSWSEDSFAEEDSFTPSKYIGARKDTEDMVRQSAADGIRSFVIRPPLIWGHGKCLAIANIYASAARTGRPCYIGQGLNLYSNVHVDDLTELYRLAVERGIAGQLFHAVSGECNFRSLAEAVGQALGVPARSVSFQEACEIWGKFTALIGFAVCSRSRAPLARRALGWAPSTDRLDILEETAHAAFTEYHSDT